MSKRGIMSKREMKDIMDDLKETKEKPPKDEKESPKEENKK
ncbi:hypothetical protein PM10SUCC1_21780 [Propionigenium maris DSM 9537]|uniref:Uncharacterized protein n=1 Tax=Propionigenium maris DSM 9537 TaxID=1123000 RepID=A0A9W6GK76_9FUSO|nr:hypothetical protein [Propionigenium maris]GLI56664.1 hypothetical protein PM10SUCC1_21780 [Propionigenium maris DSM 9537]